jgi:hypothetical protein
MVNLVALPFEIILFMAFLDIAWTHFHFFLDRKKGLTSTKMERNPIIRKFFMKQVTPLSFLAGILYVFTVLTLLFIVAVKFTNYYSDYIYLVFGMYFLLNYIHLMGIEQTYKNWNNEAYWKAYKELDDAEIV